MHPTPLSRHRAVVAGGLATALVLLGTVAAVAGGEPRGARTDHAASPSPTRAKNVILFLGDGMGDSEITIARNYAKGANGRLTMDNFRDTGEYKTYSVVKGTSSTPVYVTDSAASGTGWATGHKSYNGAISVDPVTQAPLPTILELARDHGYATGDVTTAELTDATPAVLDSHVVDRSCEGPADMAACPGDKIEAGGLGSIAEQSVSGDFDVLLGGSTGDYGETVTGGPYAGQTVTQEAQAKGYQVVTDRAGLAAATAHAPLLGLFAPGNMDLEYAPYLAAPYPANLTPQQCSANPAYPSSEPHLAEMTSRALDLLSAKAQSNDNGKGFFLQVEGASIDKQDHAENVCGQIGETLEFDQSIKLALDWAKRHPQTLIVVTADHGHTSQIIDPQTATDHSPGAIATLLTADNQPMVVNYATNLNGRSQDHTGTEVRIAAQGPQAERVRGITNQTDLFHTFARALGIE